VIKIYTILVLLLTMTLFLIGFTNKPKTEFTDPRDNQTYKIVQIGNKMWLKENLNFRTNTSICYDSLNANCDKYGRLYSYSEAQRACPEFWRLPTQQDVDELHERMGSNKLFKIAAPDEWEIKKAKKIKNELGLSILPAGRIDSLLFYSKEENKWIDTVAFHQLGIATSFWINAIETSEGPLHWHVGEPIGPRESGLHRHPIFPDIHKFSVRCVCEVEK